MVALTNASTHPTLSSGALRSQSFVETVRGYVETELSFHDEGERAGLLRRLDELIEGIDAP